jgi:hypothetical protein
VTAARKPQPANAHAITAPDGRSNSADSTEAEREAGGADCVRDSDAAPAAERARRQRRDDQAREHQVHPHQLHRCGDRQREQAVEAEAAKALRQARAQADQHQRRHQREPAQLRPIDPEDLAHQQVLQVFAAVRVAGQHQDARAGGEHERHADQRLLLRAGAPLGPRQQRGPGERCRHRGRLHRSPVVGKTECIGDDHAQPRHLRHREVDEHDAAVEHLRAERHVRGQHQQPGDERQPEDRPVERVQVHGAPLAPRGVLLAGSTLRGKPSARLIWRLRRPRAACRACRRTARRDPSPRRRRPP